MNSDSFIRSRNFLKKSQSQMATLLGISVRAVQSFEQGWRNIPASVERQMLFLLSLKISSIVERKPCWEIRGCPDEWRVNCPAWELKAGEICWLINGTFCNGKPRSNWKKKLDLCRQCEVFRKLDLPIEA